LKQQEVRRIIDAGTPQSLYAGKRVLVLTPDATRTCPLPMMIKALQEVVGPHCVALDFMVALGTHPPMPEADILRLYGISEDDRKKQFAGCRFLNHRWDLPDTLATIGYLEALEIEAFSQGRLKERVPVAINRAVFDYDLVLILGPVFPHEVVGFLRGGQIPFPRHCRRGFSAFLPLAGGGHHLCRHHRHAKIHPGAGRHPPRPGNGRCPGAQHRHGGHPRQPALRTLCRPCGRILVAQAADLSDRVHIVLPRGAPYPVVLGQAPAMYDEIWVAGKVMYKLEQVVADGGRLIIYGPHITAYLAHLGAMDRKGRLPRAGLLPETDGCLPGRAPRRAGPLDPRAGHRHL
jgi:hypothetical protein